MCARRELSDGCFFYGKRGGLCFLGGCFGCGDGGSLWGIVVAMSARVG